MSIKIYSYDNHTGRDIPSKISTFPVDLILGSTLMEIQKSITECQLFFVCSHIQDADFIVQSESDKTILKTVLNFGNHNYKVDVHPESIWYSSKAEKNIIISDSVKLNSKDLSVVLAMFLNEIQLKKKADGKLKETDIYTVKNTRNGKEIFKTPSIHEAVKTCDKNPCCIIYNKKNEVIYHSAYGKLSIPKSLKATVNNQKNNAFGIAKIRID